MSSIEYFVENTPDPSDDKVIRNPGEKQVDWRVVDLVLTDHQREYQ